MRASKLRVTVQRKGMSKQRTQIQTTMTDKLRQPTHPLFTARAESRNDLAVARSLPPGVALVPNRRANEHLATLGCREIP